MIVNKATRMTEWEERTCDDCRTRRPVYFYLNTYWQDAAGAYDCAHCRVAIGVLDPDVAAASGALPLCPSCDRTAHRVGVCSCCWGAVRLDANTLRWHCQGNKHLVTMTTS